MRMLINVDVPDLQKGIAFYTAALGLRLSRTLDGDVAELKGAACDIYLLENGPGTPVSSKASIGRDYARHWTPVHIDFVVENLEGAVRQALAAGAKQESEQVDWMQSKCITFSDPFGHGFCLIEFADGTYQEPIAPLQS
jgi:catechol 2,3-dioxygenase-like lactoylglutathione lyase family enzyme